MGACGNEHKEYNTLAREVASNVRSRKQVFISTLVIGCYTDNITSNRGAKGCADRKRRASTSQWNIHAGSLTRCAGKASLTNSFGPANWQPSIRTCEKKHWHEKAHKEKASKHEKKTKEGAKKASEKKKKHQKSCKSGLRFKSATYSGNRHGHSAAYGPRAAIDNNSRTRVGIAGSWTGDFGKVVHMSSLSASWEACQCAKRNSVVINVSADGKKWRRWGAFGGWHQWGGRKSKTIKGSKAMRVRFVRFIGTNQMRNRWMSMWSISANGCEAKREALEEAAQLIADDDDVPNDVDMDLADDGSSLVKRQQIAELQEEGYGVPSEVLEANMAMFLQEDASIKTPPGPKW